MEGRARQVAYNDTKYHNWYNKHNYDRISFFVPKGTRERLKEAAKALGLSVNAYITGFLPQSVFTQRDYVGWKGNNDESISAGHGFDD